MREIHNLANALLIIASIYFLFQIESIWAKIGIIIILLFGVATWSVEIFTKDHKKLLNKQIEEVESRIRLNNSNAAFTTANALYLQEQITWNRNKR